MAFTQQFVLDVSGIYFINKTGTSGKKDRIATSNSPQNQQNLVLDSNDCIYTTGKHYNDTPSPVDSQSHTIKKHTELGHLVWQDDIGGADGNKNAVSEGAIDEFNGGIALYGDYVYTVGYRVPAGDRNCYFFKYNRTTGDLEWKKNYNDNLNIIFYNCATDSSGNLYIVGKYTASNGTTYGLFVKVNSSGVIQWQKRVGGGGILQFTNILIDSSDNIFVIGKHQDGSNQPASIYKFNTSASIIWKKMYHNSQYTTFYSMDVDSSGNIYAAGNSGAPLLMKLNSSGTIQWCKKIGTSGLWNSPKQRCFGVAVDSSDKIYIIGRNGPNNSSWKTLISQFNSSGNVQWLRDFGIASVRNSGYEIAVDSRDNLVVLGDHDNNSTYKSFFLARLPNDGSKTGTYSVGGDSYSYSTASTFTITDLTGWSTSTPSASTTNASTSVSNSSLDNNSYTATSSTTII